MISFLISSCDLGLSRPFDDLGDIVGVFPISVGTSDAEDCDHAGDEDGDHAGDTGLGLR